MYLLGFVISKEGIAADPDKVNKAAFGPVASGFASYYCQFTCNFVEIIEPLYHSTEQATCIFFKRMLIAKLHLGIYDIV